MASFPDNLTDEQWQTAHVLGRGAGGVVNDDLDDIDLALFAAATNGASADGENGFDINADEDFARSGTAKSSQPSVRGLWTEIPVRDAGGDSRIGASTWAEVVAGAHAMDPGAEHRDMRGKHDRANTQKTVPWSVTGEAHLAKIQNASLLGESRCSSN
eukprot:5906688-Pleurochrysis_carterae.AAC.1